MRLYPLTPFKGVSGEEPVVGVTYLFEHTDNSSTSDGPKMSGKEGLLTKKGLGRWMTEGERG